MLDIEPPEVPTELLVVPEENSMPHKKSFFQKLFSWKKRETIDNTPLNDMPTPVFQESFPNLPPLNIPNTEDDWAKQISEANDIKDSVSVTDVPKKNVGKGKGKRSKDKKVQLESVDVSKRFSWNNPINEQDEYIKDSNRNNEAVNKLISASEQHVEDTQKAMDNMPEIVGEEMTRTGLKTNVPEDIADVIPKAEQDSTTPLLVADMPMVHPEEQKTFNELDKQHQKLRDKLNKKIRDKNFSANKKEFMQLLKDYDERIEHKIERKQIELSNKHVKLDALKESLQAKSKELSKLHSHLKRLQDEINVKESRIDQIINTTVKKQVSKHTEKERKVISKGLKETLSLNKKLRKELDVLEKDRMLFDKKKEKLLEAERKKVTAVQIMYEKKLNELTEERNSLFKERNDFEVNRANALEMLNRAGEISTELKELQHLREVVQTDKNIIDKELTQDKELKDAIENAEARVSIEKRNLDSMIFSKYIEWKLNSAPNSLLSTSLFKDEIDSMDTNNKLYPMISECKKLISQKKMLDAKKMYNKIKDLFESSDLSKVDKSMIYNSLRALYNEIKLAELTYVAD
jgi:hypothetical protein